LLVSVLHIRHSRDSRGNVPEPAPVTIADLPLTERAMTQLKRTVYDSALPARRKSTLFYVYGLVEHRPIIAARKIAVFERRGTPRRDLTGASPVDCAGRLSESVR